MISKLPRWVWTGAWVLAFMAGIINVVGLLGFDHQAVTHLTGTTSMFSNALSEGDWWKAWRLFEVVGSFALGAVASGILIQDSALKLGRRYGVALALEAVLLAICVPLLMEHRHLGVCLASAGCGLQNAMATTYSGSTVRTTHLSGMFTDLGIYLGHLLRGIPVDWRRLKLCVTIIAGFACGGVAGALLFRKIVYFALWIPAFMAGSGAIFHGLARLRRSTRA